MGHVELRGIEKSFGSDTVLRGVDLDVEDASIVSLLGPSGSGKSTLLRIVAGLEPADAGTVRLAGTDVTDQPTHRRDVGFVFQDQSLFPHLDVGDNVGFGLRMHGVGGGQRRARVAEALELVGLPGFEKRDTATLSGGEAQRVALARALAPQPSVVLLDEPLAALDQLLRERLLLELRELFAKLSVTVVVVTHDPTEAGALGDRLAVLLDGRVAQFGAPGDVLARPSSAAVAGLVGHRNLVEGTMADGVVSCAWGRFPTPPRNDGGGVVVLVRPDGIRSGADGDLEGRVTGLLFRGGSAFAVVQGRDWPALDLRAEPGWQMGSTVRLAIDPAAVHVMTA